MKKLVLSLTAILLTLSLAACATEELPALKGGNHQAEAAPLDGDAGADVAVITVTDPEAPQSDGDWKEWECIAERPYDDETAAEVSTSDSTPADPINTAPADLNDSLPTLTLIGFTNGTAEFSVQNNTQYEWGYDLKPYFHKYNEDNGVWLDVEPVTEIWVNDVYCILQPGGSSTYTLPIERYYGKLPDGQYRAGLIMKKETELCEAELILCELHFIDGEIARVIACS